MKSIEFLKKIINNNGPESCDYNLIDEICAKNPELLKTIKTSELDFLNSTESIMGHIFQKPFGYAGDFQIIDRIYTKDKSVQYYKWDNYSLENTAAIAVRNRKEYFKSMLTGLSKVKKHAKILDIASGPLRDVYEFLNQNQNQNFTFQCVDLDPKSIEYAKNLNIKNLSRIEFINKNILRFQTNEKFDLVWSAGLFDYFSDKVFVSILHRMKNWLKSDGEIIIGNFNQDNNPSRNFMEIIGEWYLHHRTEEELINLAILAGFSRSQINVGREPENVNLFLHIKAE
ncbi:class I SAM-dependent methyltransferase [Saprospiraceae bacterium]|nr:class I SAM-dependent methyltransferase [Saprospiraceae bacterium]